MNSGLLFDDGSVSRSRLQRSSSSTCQLLAQSFGAFAVEGGLAPGTCVMLLRPWAGSNEVPPGVLGPQHGDLVEGGHTLDEDDLKSFLSSYDTVLVPCTFEDELEVRSGMNIFQQVREASHRVILVAALVLPQDLEDLLGLSDDILRRHNILVSTRPSVTLLDPPWQHTELRRILSIECCALNPAVRYAEALEEHHVQAKALERSIASQESRLHDLLWVSGPQAVMRNFPELNRDILENESGVGSFVFVAKLHGSKNPVVEAHRCDGQVVVVKKIRKAGLMDPLQVERIYREFIWLRYELRHPHIIKCVEAIHTRKSLYLVFEHMGRLTLAQFLDVEGPAGQFLADQEALRCFSQIAGALAYCHGKNVCHNAVSLDTVFVSSADFSGDAKPRAPFGCGLGRPSPSHLLSQVPPSPLAESGQRYTLSGFDKALKATSNLKRSSGARGRELPFVAPDVGSDAKEFPATSAEAWSLGVLLLEASGGLGSVAHCVNGCLTWDQERVPHEIVKICRFFAAPGAHKRALRSRFGVESEAIVDILGRLMVVDSSRRAEVADVVTELSMSSERSFRMDSFSSDVRFSSQRVIVDQGPIQDPLSPRSRRTGQQDPLSPRSRRTGQQETSSIAGSASDPSAGQLLSPRVRPPVVRRQDSDPNPSSSSVPEPMLSSGSLPQEGGLPSRPITLPTSERWGETFVRGKRRPAADVAAPS
mmetsp:Transcript_147596/g.472130  ORF Transcript_147596/g.472130 Transcript_147596/m.472130 type:complete len:706 (-) Transcript_147596:17-2134(-)